MNKGQDNFNCQVVANRGISSTGNWKWIGKGPTTINILQASRLVSPDDIGKYVLSVKLPGSTHHQFYTPTTPVDTKFWTNGLDGVMALAEGFFLFGTLDEACVTGHRFRWEESSVYEVVLSSEGTVLFDERVVAGGKKITNFTTTEKPQPNT